MSTHHHHHHPLHSGRLILQPWTSDDVETIQNLLEDHDIRRFVWDGEKVGREEIERVVGRAGDALNGGMRMWNIVLKTHGSAVGFCGFRFAYHGVELLLALAAPHRSRGYGAEACRSILQHGFESRTFTFAYARVNGTNISAMKLVQKLGMELDGASLLGESVTLQYSITGKAL